MGFGIKGKKNKTFRPSHFSLSSLSPPSPNSSELKLTFSLDSEILQSQVSESTMADPGFVKGGRGS